MAAIYEVNPRIRMKAGLRERRSCGAIRGKYQRYKNRMAAIYEVNPRIRMKAGLRERRSCGAIRGKHQN
ncbi:hypothetical protein [Anthropogastromicrobium aceti]|uniref:hypothetical protein n=1 Tax=Anthropogastromicrobium aceti TaxID=2981768 RepID=UPI0021CEB0E8|nr:hypothetical protein [Anthropogastromicrobium aceti]